MKRLFTITEIVLLMAVMAFVVSSVALWHSAVSVNVHGVPLGEDCCIYCGADFIRDVSGIRACSEGCGVIGGTNEFSEETYERMAKWNGHSEER